MTNDERDELMIRVDERVRSLVGLPARVDSLESDRDKVKGVAYIGGSSGVVGFLTALWHFFKHGA